MRSGVKLGFLAGLMILFLAVLAFVGLSGFRRGEIELPSDGLNINPSSAAQVPVAS